MYAKRHSRLVTYRRRFGVHFFNQAGQSGYDVWLFNKRPTSRCAGGKFCRKQSGMLNLGYGRLKRLSAYSGVISVRSTSESRPCMLVGLVVICIAKNMHTSLISLVRAGVCVSSEGMPVNLIGQSCSDFLPVMLVAPLILSGF
jgi:hypothetical protein